MTPPFVKESCRHIPYCYTNSELGRCLKSCHYYEPDYRDENVIRLMEHRIGGTIPYDLRTVNRLILLGLERDFR